MNGLVVREHFQCTNRVEKFYVSTSPNIWLEVKCLANSVYWWTFKYPSKWESGSLNKVE